MANLVTDITGPSLDKMLNYSVTAGSNISNSGNASFYQGNESNNGGGATQEEIPFLYTIKVVTSVLFSLVFVLGVLGNTLVILAATGRIRGLHKTMSVLILNLSFADLLYLVFCLPFHATLITVPSWMFGGFMCKMVQFLIYASMCASSFTLVAMSMDRYFAVVHPLKFFGVRTLRNVICVISFIWALAIACAAPFLFVFETFDMLDANGDEVSYCVEVWPDDNPRDDIKLSRRYFYTFLFVISYMLPLLLMITSYLLILRALWTTFKPSEDSESSANNAKKKVTLIVSVVVLAFGICWLPHHIMYMWILYGDFPFTDGTLVLKVTEIIMSSCNSCLNPIIYSIMSENFRQALRRYLRRCTSSRERTKVVPRHRRMKLLNRAKRFQVC
ncbi:galanin receptor type 1-like [Asterias rubens]|uniref:Galanin receptor n=1 Tax=Asterias rubens TaxID=7604 RepID=A0A1N7TCF1_ASTRU|nr:galanin receptor type 1-like [Asterias rubens]ALM01493.1 galanin receptor [Asterias rubens]